MKKRILSMVLAIALIFAIASPAAAASSNDPIIMIAGYTATQMFANPASSERELVWNLDPDAVLDAVKKELAGLIGGGLLYFVSGWTKVFTNAFSRAADAVVGQLALQPDGSRTADVGPWPGTAADFSSYAIRSSTDPNARYLSQLSSFVSRFEASGLSRKRMFVFQYDWRNPTLLSAQHLRSFIQQVKEITGSSSVRIFGSSYGAQLCAAYLYDYAHEGDVSKIVMEFPALGGSSMIPDLLMGKNFSLDNETITRFVQSFMETDMQLEALTKLLWLRPLYPLLNDTLQAALLPIAKTWGSLWDLLPADAYESTKAAVLAQGEQYAWEPYCDRMHRDIMPNMGKLLQSAQEEHGIQLRIVANTGSPHLLGKGSANSDGLLDVCYTTGAKVLPLGEHGITQSGTVCSDASHGHISPGQDIDASAAWLPDNTWFVQGQYHGASYYDPYALDLGAALMFGEINTVHDDPAFPQFSISRVSSESLYASFDGTALHIENISLGRNVMIHTARAAGIQFGAITSTVLKPGESITVPASAVTAEHGSYTPITVRYTRYSENGIGLPACKTFDYTYKAKAAQE